MTVTEQTFTNEVDETVDLAKVGVLTDADLEEHVFKYGDTTDAPVLRPGERLALLADQRTALLYGYIPAVRAAATALEYVGSDPDPSLEMVAKATVEPAAWALFTRHLLSCAAGGGPVACGCAPADDPDGYYLSGATEATPGAVLVTPVILPAPSETTEENGEPT